MIRPLTIVCALLAGGSGLYLYQTKHTSQMLDREIARTIKLTETARERIGMLRGEWALLNEPERLSELQQQHLGLKTLSPTQFASLDQLAGRLPAPVAPGTVVLPPGFGTDEDAAPATPAAVTASAGRPGSRTATAMAAQVPAAPAPGAANPAAAAPPSIAATPPAAATPSTPVQTAELRPSAPVRAAARTAPPPATSAPSSGQPSAAVVATARAPRAFTAPVVSVAAAPMMLRNQAATAPGTVGEAVLRAMEARGQVPAASPAAPMVIAAPAYAPVVASVAAPIYSALGGGRPALPPPVPVGTR